MKHMEHLETVVKSDVAVLRAKERTYQGSWKVAGGRSAWFMARRNLDRLLNMMEHKWNYNLDWTSLESVTTELKNEQNSEDIFAKIMQDPSGADGSVLAVMRDARRYFVLVEAEMMAREVVIAERTMTIEERKPDQLDEIMSRVQTLFEALPGIAQPSARQAIVDLAAMTGVDRLVEQQSLTEEQRCVPRFEDARPWVVALIDLVGMKKIMSVAYVHWTKDSLHLEPHLTEPEHYELQMEAASGFTQASSALRCYSKLGTGWVLKIEEAPPEYRDRWPVLRREYNSIEHEGLPHWQGELFAWVTEGTGWRVRPEHEAWTRGEEQ